MVRCGAAAQARVFAAEYLFAGCVGMVELLARIGQALLLKEMVESFSDLAVPAWAVFLDALGMFLLGVVVAFAHQHFFYRVRDVAPHGGACAGTAGTGEGGAHVVTLCFRFGTLTLAPGDQVRRPRAGGPHRDGVQEGPEPRRRQHLEHGPGVLAGAPLAAWRVTRVRR